MPESVLNIIAALVLGIVIGALLIVMPTIDSGEVVELRSGRTLFGQPFYLLVVEGRTHGNMKVMRTIETDSKFGGYSVGDYWQRNF